jgi:DNA-binding CsgD family transcriptional regulator
MSVAPLDHVADLVDHSLLQRTIDPDGEPRFAMLESIREFALEQLDAHGERDKAERARTVYLLALAERLELASLMSGSEVALAIVAQEHANIREALSWLTRNGDLEMALRLAGALAFNWIAMAHYAEGQAWLEPLLANPDVGSARLRGRALVGLGLMRMFQRDFPRADSALRDSIDLLRTRDEPLHLAIALIGHGGAQAEIQGDASAATGPLTEALNLAGNLEDPRLAAFVASLVHETHGATANVRGDLAGAQAHHQEALALRRAADFNLGVCISLRNLGLIARDQGNLEGALAYFRELLELATEHWSPLFIVDALNAAADIAMAWDQPEVAARFIGMVDALRGTLGYALAELSETLVPDELRKRVQAALGDEGVLRMQAEGGALTLDEAIAEVNRLVPPVGQEHTLSTVARHYGLTMREVEILRRIADLMTDREIAGQLFLSRRTVSWHVTSILAKLGVESRREAASRAVEEHII